LCSCTDSSTENEKRCVADKPAHDLNSSFHCYRDIFPTGSLETSLLRRRVSMIRNNLLDFSSFAR
jgi:hypothetical protein